MARFIISAFADEASKEIKKQIEACKKNGITHIELRGLDDGKNINNITPDDAKELKKTLDEGGIGISALGSGYGKIEITDDFEPHFEAFKNTVEVANILGADRIRMFSFYFKNGEDYAEYKDEVIRRMGIMCDYALSKGVKCYHENECGIYGDIPERCLELHEALGDKLGGVFDPANYIHCDVDILKAYDMLEPYIDYMHVKDARYSDGAVTPAGEGDANFTELLRRYNNKGGRLLLTIEPHLALFEGLENLESTHKLTDYLKKDFTYASRDESFAAAANALHKQIELVQPIRYGIIGVGNMGTSHVRSYESGQIKEMRITAVADINPERLKICEEILPGVKTFNTAEELIDSGCCDAVIVATPHYLHPPLIKYALSKGLHALTEKPAGVYTKQVREMNEFAAQHKDKTFAIMLNQRTNCVYRKMKEIVSSGKYGEIKRVNWIITDWFRTQSYYNSGGWRATWAGEGGGVLLNQCPHNLDLWQWICGMPSKIKAFCHEGKWHDIEVEDDVTIYAEYPNGATGVFVTTTGDAPGTNRFEITLDGAKLVCEDGAKLTLYVLEDKTSDFLKNAKEGFAKPKGHYEEVELDGKNEQHVGVINAFAAHIIRNEPLVADGSEGINGLTISNAAHLSSWLGKEIELPVDEDLFYEELQKKIKSSTKEKKVVEIKGEVDMSGTYGS
ncbi:MAG: TIM barrel protein [Clostridiales bacterium]|nr:TIM barrel protein [Clostridiales bacterium]